MPQSDTATEVRRAGPCTMVIFGASGDLTRRKLLPALYNLSTEGLLPEKFAVVGTARGEMSDDAFRSDLADAMRGNLDHERLRDLLQRVSFVRGDLAGDGNVQDLRDRIASVDRERGTEGNVLFYLATPPDAFGPIVRRLGDGGLADETEGRWRRVVVEKPFGRDLASARRLNAQLAEVLDEGQIYRIDHYLGKETVQNILVFRFANGIFEPIWNHHYIDHVQITVAEELGVEHRAGYYEGTGALRDMVPNHLFQLVSLVAMEPPISFEADAVRDEKAKVLRAVQPFTEEDVIARTVRGQYDIGELPDGTTAPAYRREHRVAADSTTETFVALKLLIDSWRWADVPFYLRTGKRMPTRLTEVVIQFKRVPFQLFRDTAIEHVSRNQLVLRIQPNEAITLTFEAKIPGPSVRLSNVDMEFCYSDHFGVKPTTGYETLLYDCMMGDATLFQRADGVELGWSAVQSVLDIWQALPPRSFPDYAAGSWGPAAADELLARDGRRWRNP